MHRIPDRGSIDILMMLSDDRFRILGEAGGALPVPIDAIEYITTWQQGRLVWRWGLTGGWRNELAVLAGPQTQRVELDDGQEAFERRVAIDVREELVKDPEPGKVGWRVGIDLRAGPERFLFDVDDFGPREEGEGFAFAPAFYVEPTARLGPVTLVGGVRADLVMFPGIQTFWGIDPRLSMRVDVADRTVVRAAVGRFSSFPTLRQIAPVEDGGDGDPLLVPSWALQSSVGVDQGFPHGLSLELTFFHSALFDLVVGRENRLRFYTVPPSFDQVDVGPYANAGAGRSYGLELLFKWEQSRVTMWFSGTLTRSERVLRPEEIEAPFRFDQPVVLNALATYALPKRWRIGARLRYASGNPYTPVVGRFYDLNERVFRPVPGDPYSARLPDTYGIDLRVDKQWVFRNWGLSMYLDVLNTTNARPIEIPTWNADYSELQGVAGLPIVPVFGLEGTW